MATDIPKTPAELEAEKKRKEEEARQKAEIDAAAASKDSTEPAPVDSAPVDTPASDGPATGLPEAPAAPAADTTPTDTAPPADTTAQADAPAPDGSPADTTPPVDAAPAIEPPADVPTEPSPAMQTLSEREARLRAVQKAHEDWVGENRDKEPKSTQSAPDASQFAMDTDLPQGDFVKKVEDAQAANSEDPLDTAVSRLQELLKQEGLDKDIKITRLQK